MEEWKDIKGYEGVYQVSNLGRVKSLPRHISRYNDNGYLVKEKVLKQMIHTGGYLQVGLRKNGKTTCKFVHRLVGEAFILNLNQLPQINHKDEDKTNNKVSNLEWCDNTYNNIYGTKIERQKQSEYLQRVMKPIKGTNLETGEVLLFDSVNSATKKGFVRRGIRGCLDGIANHHHGYRWEYV
ncbi:MAG: NUMOD4 domain-containing protein [Bacillota bacterium]